MTPVTAPVLQGFDDPVAAYEALRAHVLVGSPGGGQPGLVVLLRQGMASWLASRHVPVRPVARVADTAASAFPADASCAALVRLLAGIVLAGQKQEVVVP